MDQPHRPDHFGTRGPRSDHHLQPGARRHPPGPSHRRRPHRGQASSHASTTWCGTPGYSLCKRQPPRTPWPKPASPRPSSPSPTSGGAGPSPATPFSSTASSSRPISPRPPRPSRATAWGLRRGKTHLRGQVQPAGALAPGPTRRPRRRRRHPVALPVLRRLAAEPDSSQDHEGLAPSSPGELPEDVTGCCSGILSVGPGRAGALPTHPLRHHGVANLHGPAPGGRVGERGA